MFLIIRLSFTSAPLCGESVGKLPELLRDGALLPTLLKNRHSGLILLSHEPVVESVGDIINLVNGLIERIEIDV